MNTKQLKIIDTLSDSIKEVNSIITPFLEYINEKNIKTTFYYSLEFLFETIKRLNFNIQSIDILFEQFKKLTIDHPIGLILRSSLLDLIYLFYLKTEFLDKKINISWVEKELEKIYCDQLEFTYKSFKTLKNKEIINNNKLNSFTSKLILKYPKLVFNTETGISFKEKWRKSTIDLIAKIKNCKNTKDYWGIYDLWLFYSKYEHYGGLTYEIERISIINRISNIARSIYIIIWGITDAIQMLININETINFEKKDELFVCIENLTNNLVKLNILKTDK